jgi:hypothetical protein
MITPNWNVPTNAAIFAITKVTVHTFSLSSLHVASTTPEKTPSVKIYSEMKIPIKIASLRQRNVSNLLHYVSVALFLRATLKTRNELTSIHATLATDSDLIGNPSQSSS